MAEFNEELDRRFATEASTSAQEEKAAKEAEENRIRDICAELRSSKLLEKAVQFNNIVIGEGFKEKVPTGFDGIDLALNGGLSPRLYLISADTSMGKSTLAWNIAQNIARNSAKERAAYDSLPAEEKAKTIPPKIRSVLYFLQEMTAEEMMARAISRRMLERNGDKKNKVITPMTEDQILYQYQNAEEVSPEQQAIFGTEEGKFLQEEAKYLYIIEGRKTVEEIEEYIRIFMSGEYVLSHEDARDYNKNYLTSPIVVVDYLQILAETKRPDGTPLYREPRLQVDHNTEAFVRMKTEYGTPIILISSVTKQAQGNLTIDMTALKESGTISFDVDCVITMNYETTAEQKKSIGDQRSQEQRLDKKKEAKEEQRSERPRHIVLTFEKNRGGIIGTKVKMLYNSAFNAFFDDPDRPDYTERQYKDEELIPPIPRRR